MPLFYVFAKSDMIISCSDIVLSLYRSSTERFRDMQPMSLYRLCRDIVLPRYSLVTLVNTNKRNKAIKRYSAQIGIKMTFRYL